MIPPLKSTPVERVVRRYMVRRHLIPSLLLKPFFPVAKERFETSLDVNTFLWKNRHVSKASEQIPQHDNYFLYKDKGTGLVSLLFKTLPERVVGSGQYKVYHESTTIDLPLPSNHDEAEKYLSVIMKPYDPAHLESIREGNEDLIDLLKKDKPKGVYLSLPLIEFKEGIFTMRRYAGCGESFNIYNDLQSYLWRDMTRTILWVQEQKKYHQDVNWKNFLVDVAVDHEGIKRGIAYLIDFDSMDIAGAHPMHKRNPTEFKSWDASRCYGSITTPFVGYYGLIQSHLILWTENDSLEAVRRKIHWVIANNLLRRTPREYYVKFVGRSKPLSSLQERAWNLFILICEESSKVCLKLKDIEVLITPEMVEEAMKTSKEEEIKKELLSLADDLCKEAEK